MEAGDRAAGDGDEEEGEDQRRVGRVPLHHRRGELQRLTLGPLDRRCPTNKRGDAQADDNQPQCRNKLQRVDIVARLQEQPDRQHGGDVRVNQQNADPTDDVQRGHVGVERPEQTSITKDHRRVHHAQCENGRQQQAHTLAVQVDADRDGDGDLYEAREDRRGVLLEHSGDDQPKDRDHDRQCKEEHEEEEQPDAFVQQSPGYLADSLPVVAQAHDERAEVVDGADEDRAEDDPE